MSISLTPAPTSVDEAIRDLIVAAGRAPGDLDKGVTADRADGILRLRFESREQYHAWCDFGLIAMDMSPRLRVDVDWGSCEISIPVTFGDRPWPAMASYPAAPLACTCDAELVHMAGCPADEVGPVVVLDMTEAARLIRDDAHQILATALTDTTQES